MRTWGGEYQMMTGPFPPSQSQNNAHFILTDPIISSSFLLPSTVPGHVYHALVTLPVAVKPNNDWLNSDGIISPGRHRTSIAASRSPISSNYIHQLSRLPEPQHRCWLGVIGSAYQQHCCPCGNCCIAEFEGGRLTLVSEWYF